MDKKSIRNLVAGAVVVIAVIAVCYLIYLFGNWIIYNRYTSQYVYPFIINYVYPFVVGMVVVIFVLVVCVAFIQMLDEPVKPR